MSTAHACHAGEESLLLLAGSIGGLDRLRYPHVSRSKQGWLIDLIMSLTLVSKDL
jgi:hypothetical protein